MRLPSEGRTIGFQIKNVSSGVGADWGKEGSLCERAGSTVDLKIAAIKAMALPKTPDAIFRGDTLSLENSSKISFHFQQKLEFSTI